MHFKILTVVAAALSATQVQAQLPTSQIVKDLQDIGVLTASANSATAGIGPSGLLTKFPVSQGRSVIANR